MDDNRFDAIAKTLIAAANRRRTLGGLLGGTLAMLGLADPEDAWSAKSGRCKPKCETCERCDKGTCRRTKSGKKRCKKGKCVLRQGLEACRSSEVRNPDTCECCTVPGEPCDPQGENADCCAGFCGFPGFCAGLPEGRTCGFNEQCDSGVCDDGVCT